jgi:hypothetical protein
MNLAASRSRILDTNYAIETTKLAKAQIIQQASMAMLAQANQSNQSVLALWGQVWLEFQKAGRFYKLTKRYVLDTSLS